jgi:hypothetical protein
MDPINTPVPQPTQVITQKVNILPIVITSVLLGSLIGAMLTLGVLYYLNPDILTFNNQKSAEELDSNDKEIIPEETKTPVTEEKDVVEEIKYVSESINIEYWKGDGGVMTAKFKLPENSKITDGGGNASPTKIIKYTDEKTGATEISIVISHFGMDTKIVKYFKVDSELISNLYRVQAEYMEEETPKLYAYSNDIKLEGTCVSGSDTIKAVCGNDQVKGLIITAKNSKDNFTIADKIVSTLEVVKK